jgi:hypothetical protein
MHRMKRPGPIRTTIETPVFEAASATIARLRRSSAWLSSHARQA